MVFQSRTQNGLCTGTEKPTLINARGQPMPYMSSTSLVRPDAFRIAQQRHLLPSQRTGIRDARCPCARVRRGEQRRRNHRFPNTLSCSFERTLALHPTIGVVQQDSRSRELRESGLQDPSRSLFRSSAFQSRTQMNCVRVLKVQTRVAVLERPLPRSIRTNARPAHPYGVLAPNSCRSPENGVVAWLCIRPDTCFRHVRVSHVFVKDQIRVVGSARLTC